MFRSILGLQAKQGKRVPFEDIRWKYKLEGEREMGWKPEYGIRNLNRKLNKDKFTKKLQERLLKK